MRVIFLDIDGVLATHESYSEGVLVDGWPRFERDCVDNLNRLIRASDAEIVVSSSWRQWFCELTAIQEILSRRGVELPAYSMTPILDDYRGQEITAWLSGNSVESYVILDDSAYEWGHHQRRWVKTTMDRGLQRRHVNRAMKLFENIKQGTLGTTETPSNQSQV